LLNSTTDPEYFENKVNKQGLIKIGDMQKRYFNLENIKPFITKFKTIILDNQGEAYKDRAKGVKNLIRYIGQKTL